KYLFLQTYVVLCASDPPYFRSRRARVLPVTDSDPVCHQVMNVVQPEDWVVLGAGPPARRLRSGSPDKRPDGFSAAVFNPSLESLRDHDHGKGRHWRRHGWGSTGSGGSGATSSGRRSSGAPTSRSSRSTTSAT